MLSYTLEQAASQIATVGWANASASPVTFGFRASETGNPYFERFTAAQISATQTAMGLWSDVANIKFSRVGTGTTGNTAYTNSATILFGVDTGTSDYAFAYMPGSRAAAEIDGDVTINTSFGSFSDLSRGSYDFMAIVHEIGHAIGLDHPGNYNGGDPTYAANAAYVQDSRQYTVMSYFDAEETGARHYDTYAATPLLHDIAAAQVLYGANYATRAGNTVYGFNSNANRAQFHISSAAQDVVFAIWDGGGRDTLDLSGYIESSIINLNAGAFSSAGGLYANIAIARGALIEDAKGGAGNDAIYGNAAANVLFGNAGNDTIRGGFGNDYLAGGSGRDNFVFNDKLSGTGNQDRIADFKAADDTIKLDNAYFTRLTGAANTVLSASQFWAGSAAHDTSDRVIYNPATGVLTYDANGSVAGGTVQFAVLSAHLVLTNADFVII